MGSSSAAVDRGSERRTRGQTSRVVHTLPTPWTFIGGGAFWCWPTGRQWRWAQRPQGSTTRERNVWLSTEGPPSVDNVRPRQTLSTFSETVGGWWRQELRLAFDGSMATALIFLLLFFEGICARANDNGGKHAARTFLTEMRLEIFSAPCDAVVVSLARRSCVILRHSTMFVHRGQQQSRAGRLLPRGRYR